MQFKFTETTKTVREIYSMFKNEELIVDDSYQRRSVWAERDQIRLIETILLNFVVPSIYFWQSDTDPDTGSAITHIVDGQQRLKAIMNFIDNIFCLKENSLLEEEMKKKFKGKFFGDLNVEEKKKIWNYRLSVIQIDLEAKKEHVIKMFERLNLTEYTLNAQEKRHVIRGHFHELAEEIAANDFWNNVEVFTGRDVRRMNDVQFSATIILLWRNGIIEQSNSATRINKAYEEFKEEYIDKESDKENILTAMQMVWEFHSEDTKTFMRKTSQIYTLFSLIFYMLRKKIDVNQEHVNKFKDFVKIYNSYINEETIELNLNDEESKIYDLFKKYKQASSEGVNKYSNRVARFDVLKKLLLQENYSKDSLDSIFSKLQR